LERDSTVDLSSFPVEHFLKEPVHARSQWMTLPRPRTAPVGREQERASLRAMLHRGDSLVTLIGPGGVGKSRLALLAAAEVASLFPDGVAFVPLAPLGSPDLVAATIAESLGLLQFSGTPMQALTTYLQAKGVLLVPDNF
jgi:hypothetical protein